MGFVAALLLAASAPLQAAVPAPVDVASASVKATATVSVTILPSAVVRLGEGEVALAGGEGRQVQTYRQRRVTQQRVLVEFN